MHISISPYGALGRHGSIYLGSNVPSKLGSSPFAVASASWTWANLGPGGRSRGVRAPRVSFATLAPGATPPERRALCAGTRRASSC